MPSWCADGVSCDFATAVDGNDSERNRERLIINFHQYKYYVDGHYPSSLKIIRSLYISKYKVSETGLFLRLQVKPTQLGSIDRAIPYLRTTVPAPRCSIQTRTAQTIYHS
jgi:hypothetical protein